MSSSEILEIESIKKELEGAPSFLTINEAAKILRVAYFTVYRLIMIGELDATKVAGVWRIPKSALVDYLQRKHPFNTEYI